MTRRYERGEIFQCLASNSRTRNPDAQEVWYMWGFDFFLLNNVRPSWSTVLFTSFGAVSPTENWSITALVDNLTIFRPPLDVHPVLFVSISSRGLNKRPSLLITLHQPHWIISHNGPCIGWAVECYTVLSPAASATEAFKLEPSSTTRSRSLAYSYTRPSKTGNYCSLFLAIVLWAHRLKKSNTQRRWRGARRQWRCCASEMRPLLPDREDTTPTPSKQTRQVPEI